MATEPLYLDNDANVAAGAEIANGVVTLNPLKVRDFTTGVLSNFTGETITCFVALTNTKSATAVHADLSITLTEDAVNEGVYWGGFSGDKITQHLATYVDQEVYIIWTNMQNYRRVLPIMVADPRTNI